jgi:N-acetylglutamate synthase-like GNAT family acetyltransferase
METEMFIIRAMNESDIGYIIMLKKLADISSIVLGKSKITVEKIIFEDYNDSKSYFQNKFLTMSGYVIIYNEHIVGCGFLGDEENAYRIETVYIEPSFQKQGLGTKIILYFIAKAKSDGKSKLQLETSTAQDFYKKLGFVDIPNSFGMEYTIK